MAGQSRTKPEPVRREALALLQQELDKMSTIEPPLLTRLQAIAALAPKIVQLRQRGWSEQALVDVLQAEMPGLTASALRLYLSKLPAPPATREQIIGKAVVRMADGDPNGWTVVHGMLDPIITDVKERAAVGLPISEGGQVNA